MGVLDFEAVFDILDPARHGFLNAESVQVGLNMIFVLHRNTCRLWLMLKLNETQKKYCMFLKNKKGNNDSV